MIFLDSMDREMDGRRNVFSLRNIWPDHNNKEEVEYVITRKSDFR